MPKPAPVSIASTSESTSPGCLYTIVMIVLALWIAFFPQPYALAVGVGMVIPPLAFLLCGPAKKSASPTQYLQLGRKELLCANSGFLVVGLAYRWWDEYSLMAPLPWAIASQLCTVALLLAVHLYRPAGYLIGWRTLAFALYCGSCLGLINKHFDTTASRYVQGTVIDESRWDGGSRYATVAPYLDWPDEMIAVPRRDSPYKAGLAVCSAHHPGRLGFAWSSHALGDCPLPGAAAHAPVGL